MTVTPAAVKAIALEHATKADEVIQPLIDMVERRTNRAAWGSKADDGVIFLTAHWLTMQDRAAAGMSQQTGQMTSETMGPLSRSFAAPAGSSAPYTEEWFRLTTWGLAYAELRSTVFADRVGVD